MILLTLPFIVAVLLWTLFRFLRSRWSSKRRWRFVFGLGALIGVARALIACAGWYTVEQTGGPLQIPGYIAAMLALPEVGLLGKRSGGYAVFFLSLSALLMISTMAIVAAIAWLAERSNN